MVDESAKKPYYCRMLSPDISESDWDCHYSLVHNPGLRLVIKRGCHLLNTCSTSRFSWCSSPTGKKRAVSILDPAHRCGYFFLPNQGAPYVGYPLFREIRRRRARKLGIKQSNGAAVILDCILYAHARLQTSGNLVDTRVHVIVHCHRPTASTKPA